MSYVALYRKWRPDTFDEVKGQDHIVTTLRNQIKNDRLGHAFLFCGTRGTGKTSIAKIFAKACNCEHPVDGSPCNECASCRAISDGSSLNVIEIDDCLLVHDVLFLYIVKVLKLEFLECSLVCLIIPVNS